MKTRTLVSGVANYLRGQVISLFLFGAALAGLVLTELATRALTQSDSYYQTYTLPRLAGAVMAFLFCKAMLRAVVFVLKRRTSKTPHVVAIGQVTCGALTDFDMVGYYCHMPTIVLVTCLVVAFIPA